MEMQRRTPWKSLRRHTNTVGTLQYHVRVTRSSPFPSTFPRSFSFFFQWLSPPAAVSRPDEIIFRALCASSNFRRIRFEWYRNHCRTASTTIDNRYCFYAAALGWFVSVFGVRNGNYQQLLLPVRGILSSGEKLTPVPPFWRFSFLAYEWVCGVHMFRSKYNETSGQWCSREPFVEKHWTWKCLYCVRMKR